MLYIKISLWRPGEKEGHTHAKILMVDLKLLIIGSWNWLMVWYYQGKSNMWLKHSGKDALKSMKKTFPEEEQLTEHVEWTALLPLVFQDYQFVYTHAGIVPYVPLNEQDREILWMPESDFYSYPKDLILKRTGGKPVIHGHTPCEYICSDGARMNCDFGANTYSIPEERALCLVDLTNNMYYVYKIGSQKILKRKIAVIA